MVKAILIAGLPGSGKSHHVEKLVRELDANKFDDFKAHARSLAFRDSLRFDELISTLGLGKTCIVADIHFCKAKAREEAVSVLGELVPGVEIEWQYFENDPEACRKKCSETERPKSRRTTQEDRPIYEVLLDTWRRYAAQSLD